MGRAMLVEVRVNRVEGEEVWGFAAEVVRRIVGIGAVGAGVTGKGGKSREGGRSVAALAS